MKKICLFCAILLFLSTFLCTPMSVFALAEDMSIVNGCNTVDAAVTLSSEGKLVDTARAVILYELNSDTMLYAYNPDMRIYPTSMVKMMTALVAIENAQLSDEVMVTRSALNSVAIGSVSAELKAGEVLTLEDLLYCAMVKSANDASAVIAEYVGGDQETFVEMMNQKAAALGCLETNYSNPHGLHDELTYTTARDLCRFTEAALENEVFRTLFKTAKYTVPATNKSPVRQIITTNSMMPESGNKKYPDDRVTGGKTGATNQGGRCIALTAEKNGMNILCIVMGAEPTVEEDGSLSRFGSFEESKELLDFAFDKFEYRQIFFDGQSISQYPVLGGASDVVTQPAQSASTVLPKDIDLSALRWVYQQTVNAINAPVQQGSVLGTVQVWYGEKCLAQTRMVAMHDVPLKTTPIVPERPSSIISDDGVGLTVMIVGALIGLLILGVIILLVVRYLRMLSKKMRRRATKKRRERRKNGRLD